MKIDVDLDRDGTTDLSVTVHRSAWALLAKIAGITIPAIVLAHMY